MYEGPPFADEIKPTSDELRAWAYSGSPTPTQDWDTVIGHYDNLELLLEIVADPRYPTSSRHFLLSSLYCMVGHSDRSDPRLRRAVDEAARADEPWLVVWARRARRVLDQPESFNRSDWCVWGYSDDPMGDP